MFATTEIDPNGKMRKAYQDVDNAIVAAEERNRLHGSETWTTVVTRYGYDDLYQLVSASGTYQDRRDWQDRYRLSFHFDEIGNILTKDQASYRFVPDGSGGWREDHATREQTYRSVYQYPSPQPHAPRHIDEHLLAESMPWPRVMSYDASGNQTGWVYRAATRRTTAWNEENRVTRVSQNGQELSRVLYDGDGERRVHLHRISGEEETAYHDQHLTLRNGRFIIKDIYAGQTRVASKMDPDRFLFYQVHRNYVPSILVRVRRRQFQRSTAWCQLGLRGDRAHHRGGYDSDPTAYFRRCPSSATEEGCFRC